MQEIVKQQGNEKISPVENSETWAKFTNLSSASCFILDNIYHGLINSIDSFDKYKSDNPHNKGVADKLFQELLHKGLLHVDSSGNFKLKEVYSKLDNNEDSLLNNQPDLARILAKRAILDRIKDPTDKLSNFVALSFSDSKDVELKVRQAMVEFYNQLRSISNNDIIESKEKVIKICLSSSKLNMEDF